MKKLTLILTLLLVPFVALAALPIALALIPAAQIGMKIMPFVAAGAAGFGVTAAANYYQATGEVPFLKEVNDAASAADHYIYQPCKLAWQDHLVTPSSFPDASDVYIGANTHLGAKLSDIKDFVMSNTDAAYQNLRNLFNANTSGGGLDNSILGSIPSGSVVQTNNGNVVLTYTGFTGTDGNVLPGNYSAASCKFPLSPVGGCYSTSGNLSGEWHCWNGQSYNGTWMTKIWLYNGSATANPPTLIPPPLVLSYPGVVSSLKPSIPPSVANEIPNVLKNIPPSLVKPTTEAVPSATPTSANAPAISNSDVSNFYKTNYGDVANYNTTNITSTSTTQEIAKGQAAVEAAKAAQKVDFPDISFTGSADLPEANQYDSEIVQPEEINFVDKVHNFINSGLPVLSAIRSSGISASGSPTMNTTIWGNPVVIDFSGQQTPLRAAGSVLVIISLILAYLIVVRS